MLDQLTQELLARYVAGACGEEDLQAVEGILRQLPEARAWVDLARADAVWLSRLQQAAGCRDHDAGATRQDTITAPAEAALPHSLAMSMPMPQIEGCELVRELNRGGQGVVYLAIQKATRRKVAVKILLHGQHASRSACRRFEREIELIAQLKHPNIISIFYSGMTTDGRPYYMMDYVQGQPLLQYVRERRLTLEAMLSLFSTICEAVQYAHQKGIIHRDLKPNNVLVESEGIPKIMDFGLAKLMGGPVDTMVSVSEQLLGTLPYMSPEQARGNSDEVDTRTDIYALGVILYELLTGRYPYPVVGEIAEVLTHIKETPVTPPRQRWTIETGIARRQSRLFRLGQCPIDDEVQTVVLKALSKERERRYQSAGEFARDVRHYLAGAPIEAKRDSGLYVLRKVLARHRTMVAIGALFLVLLSLSGAIMSLMAHQEKEARQRAEAAEHDAKLALEEAQEMRRVAEDRTEALELVAGGLVTARVLSGFTGHLHYGPSNELLVGMEDGRIRRYDALGEKLIGELPSQFRGCKHITTSCDGTQLLVLRSGGVAEFLEFPSGRCLGVVGQENGGVVGARFSPDGKMFAVLLGHGCLEFFSVPDCTLLRSVSAPPIMGSYQVLDWKGARVAAAGMLKGEGGLLICEVGEDYEVRQLAAPETKGHECSVLLSEDGRHAFVGLDLGRVVVWDLESDKVEHELIGATLPVVSLAQSGNTRIFAFGEGFSRVHVVVPDLAPNNRRMMDFPVGSQWKSEYVRSVSFDASSSLMACGTDKDCVVVWRLPELPPPGWSPPPPNR